MQKKINILSAIVLILVLISSISWAGEDENVEYRFNLTDSSYSFYGSFKIKADAKCLLELTYNINHIRAMVPDAKEVILLDQDANSCTVQYTIKKFLLFVNTSIWKRVLDESKEQVVFSLVSSENSLAVMPQLTSSTGYYHIVHQDEYLVMEYYHECHVTEKSITRIYLSRLKDAAIKFLYRFSDYACDHCNCSPITTD